MYNRLREPKSIFLIFMILLCSCANLPKQEEGCVSRTKFSMSDFPLTHDAFNINKPLKGESIIFSTKLSIPEILKFYRKEFRKREICEDTNLASMTESTFGIVFNDAKNQQIVIQGVDFAYSSQQDSRVISARIEE